MLRLFGCGCDMAASRIQPPQIVREIVLLFGLGLRCGFALRPRKLGIGSMISPRIACSAFILLTTFMIVGSVVKVAVGAHFLSLCRRTLPFRNLWAYSSYTSWRATTIKLSLTEAMTVSHCMGPLRARCVSNLTLKPQRDVIGRTLLTRGTRVTVTMKCGVRNLSFSRIRIAALRAKLQQ